MKTLSLQTIFQLIRGEYQNPHEILGMHIIERDGKNMVVVRAFLPGGQGISVVEESGDSKSASKEDSKSKKGKTKTTKTKKVSYTMEKIHEDGLFEIVIEDRSEWFAYKLKYTNHEGASWSNYDPYGFLPTISEYDRYLFGAGTHYNLYEKMGGRLVKQHLDASKKPSEKGAISGVAFTVWAPNAKNVSVIGEFNQWHTERHPMRLLGESGIWELFVPNMKEGDQYKFHITKPDGNTVDKSDPYGKYMEMRPGSASVVFGKNPYKWKDKKWIEKRKTTDHHKRPMNIYEVHLGSWKRGEHNSFLSYRYFAEDLVNYVKSMGYTHIELLPISEHPFDGSWGYQTSGYFAPTSRFGNPDDFRYFIDKCHESGIGVILDWVPAHFPKDEFCLGRFDGTALYEHEDPRIGEHLQWGTFIFNYGRREVSNFLISNVLYWFKEFHIDGLRVDAVASMLYLDFCKNDGEWLPNQHGGRENLEAVEFLKHLNSVVKGEEMGVMMIAEESTSWEGVTRDVEHGGLGFDLKWNMGWMNDFLTYIKKEPVHRKFHQNNITFAMAYHYAENYMLPISHDEVVHTKSSMIGKMRGDEWQRSAHLRVAYGFMYGHPGKKLLFMGSEFGQYNEWNEAQSLDWHLLEFAEHANIQHYMRSVNQLYLENAPFWQEDREGSGFQWIDCDDNERSMVSFIRRAGHEEVYVVCNFTPATYDDYALGVPYAGTYTEIFNSDSEEFGGSDVVNDDMVAIPEGMHNMENRIIMTVPPLGFVVMKRIKE